MCNTNTEYDMIHVISLNGTLNKLADLGRSLKLNGPLPLCSFNFIMFMFNQLNHNQIKPANVVPYNTDKIQ